MSRAYHQGRKSSPWLQFALLLLLAKGAAGQEQGEGGIRQSCGCRPAPVCRTVFPSFLSGNGRHILPMLQTKARFQELT